MPSALARARRLRALVLTSCCLLLGSAAAPASAADPVIDLETATVAQLQEQMTSGKLTAEQLTRGYVNRIAALNKRGPGLNAVRALNSAAFADAKALDLERRKGQVRGPLHGIPVLLKDNIDVAGMPTTAGSGALEDSVPDEDAPIVGRLRAAGAIILGKTNLSVFANFFGSNMPAGWSPLGGQVLNAYDTDATPSGSSSGSGSAASAGLAALTIGTETSGSIISPAAANGIVGLRPTVGLVSRTGIIPISHFQDTAGPMTRTVADAAAELAAIAGKDDEDDLTAGAPDEVPDYLDALDPDALDGKRVGVMSNANNAQFEAAVDAIEAAGATAVPVSVTAPSIPSVTTYEFKRDLNAYFARLPDDAPIRSLAEVLEYAEAHPADELKFGAARAEEAQQVDLSDPTTRTTYETTRDSGIQTARGYIDGLLEQGAGDADDLDAVMTLSGTLTGTGARGGYPQLTVPAGYTATQRRPFNVSFVGTAYSEETLLAFGHAYEQATQLRRPPSEINPAMYRCAKTTPASKTPAHSCAPGAELLEEIGEEPTLPFSLEKTTIRSLQTRMESGSLTSEKLTKAYLGRIARTNTEGPSINAVRIVNPDALDEAKALDAERKAGTVRGPMHGMPVLVKDNIDVEGLPTTAGAVALEESFPAADAPIVTSLRAAGAVILGKTNLSEFANFYSSNSVSGYSGLGGQVLTPIDLDANPSGSSSGSGAAASAGLAAATIGTETSGSIISPSNANGIVGLRPTVGLVPRTGIIPISASQDTAGPMVQTVFDAAAELGAIAGKDEEDDATDGQPATLPDYVGALDADALDGTRIAVIDNSDAIYQAAIAKVRELGATTVQIATPTPTPSTPGILNYEFKRDLNAYFARLPQDAPVKSLAEVIAFNTANPVEAIRLGMDTLTTSQAINLEDPQTKSTYESNRDNGRTRTRAAIDNALKNTTPDDPADDFAAILTPSGTLTGTGARAGYPQITVPAGYNPATHNPMNVSFNGTAYSEATLLALAYAFEQATQARQAPSETNPGTWRCVAGSVGFAPRSCAPGEFVDPPKEPVTDVTPGTDTTPVTGGPPSSLPTGPAGPAAGTPAGKPGTGPMKPKVGTAAITATGRLAGVRIACAPSAGTQCKGSVRLESGERVLGRRTFSIPANVTRTVRVPLSKSSSRLLQRKKRLRVLVTVSTRNSTGTLEQAFQRLTLKAPVRR